MDLKTNEIHNIELYLKRINKQNKLRPRFLEVFCNAEKDLRMTAAPMRKEDADEKGRETPENMEKNAASKSSLSMPAPG